jgi:hypothetical protein
MGIQNLRLGGQNYGKTDIRHTMVYNNLKISVFKYLKNMRKGEVIGTTKLAEILGVSVRLMDQIMNDFQTNDKDILPSNILIVRNPAGARKYKAV